MSTGDNAHEGRRQRIAEALTRLPGRVVDPALDEIARFAEGEHRDAEIGRRLHRERSETERAIERKARFHEWSEDEEHEALRRGGLADMIAFVDAVHRGFVPEKALLLSIAARFEDVLDDTTSLYDWTTRLRSNQTPRQNLTLEQVDRLRPLTDGSDTGRAFVKAFGLKRGRGNQGRSVERERELAELDWRYQMHARDDPEADQWDVFALIAKLDRTRRVDDLAEDSMWAMLPKQAGVPDAEVAEWLRVSRHALKTVRAMFDGAEAPDAPEESLQHRGWELACKARHRAEERVPHVSPEQVTALEDGWRNWRKTQELPTPAERFAETGTVEVNRTSDSVQTPAQHDGSGAS